jgi:hypothetical protein
LRAASGKLSAKLYDVPLMLVQWKTPDDGQRNYPKHVEFQSKNKFEKFVHLVGFIIRNHQLHSHMNVKFDKIMLLFYINVVVVEQKSTDAAC